MSASGPRWSACVDVRAATVELARRLERTLAPEAAREVPRARTALHRAGPSLTIRIETENAGQMRAALNTYLGWLALSVATVEAARGTGTPASAGAGGEALISRPR